MNKVLAAAVLFMMAMTFLSCDSSTGPSPEPLPTGVTWELQAFELSSGARLDIDDPSRYTVLFRDDGQVEIRADCNGCGGNYRSQGTSLRITVEICTLVACPDSLDGEFKAALDTAVSYGFMEVDLIINHAGGRMLFRRAGS